MVKQMMVMVTQMMVMVFFFSIRARGICPAALQP
jgi:hypothetical protein